MLTEIERIRRSYAQRFGEEFAERYSFLSPAVYMSVQERERALLRWIRDCRLAPLAPRRLLEIGCGSGRNLLDLLRFGFQPENMVGNELLPERVEAARRILPPALPIIQGDAMQLDLSEESFDVVLQSTVFSSILEADFQGALAARMWKWVAPGGGVLWYDFTFDNPRNPDVAGISVKRIRALFPEGHLKCWRITLAPPLARLVTRIHPAFYTLANSMPFLRTHVLCWVKKAPKHAVVPSL